ncbi:hypothetical protein Dsin_008755 [Dipteronia sinensis]|uniref:Reverse transcriptase zinc-binding domain n=1 Tax=Dipteronia sinensis TaxID=43782 RepID=A0AAE0AQ69_9ROSI|nr:hypothetical protein Dsin_008755 [Dipteronia sinensis]
MQDTSGWSHDDKGIFSVKSFLSCLEADRKKGMWDFLGVCPLKIEIFIWQLLHGRILVRLVLKKFGFQPSTSLMCPLCNIEEESIDHLFLLCNWLRRLWQSCMLWWDPIMHMLLNMEECCSESRRSGFPKIGEWIPPQVDALKFNVDGSDKGSPGQPGIGGVLQNHEGSLCNFSAYVGIEDAITAEILAIARACELCEARPEIVDKLVVIFSHSKVAVTWINNDGFGSIKHAQIIHDTRSFLSSSDMVSILFCPRSFNYIADQLAKKGARISGEELNWWDS